MNPFKLTSLLILLNLTIVGKSKVDDPSRGYRILNKIFIELTRNCSLKKPKPPPPPPPVYDGYGNIIGYDTVGFYILLKKFQSDFIQYDRSTDKELLLIADTMYSYPNWGVEMVEKELPSADYAEILNNMNHVSGIENHLIDVNAIHNTGKFKLMNISRYLKNKDSFKIFNNPDHPGVFMISRIYLNKPKNLGVFYCAFSCGQLCGHGEFIFLRKIKNRWTIEKRIIKWIS